MTTQPLSRDIFQQQGVRCPMCLTEFRIDDQKQELVGPDNLPTQAHLAGENVDKRHERLFRSRRRCPGSEGSTEHFLPYFYADPDPIVLGAVGVRGTGKTHLLAAMVSQLTDPQIQDQLGIVVNAVDPLLHAEFHNRFVKPFIVDRQELSRTPIATYVLAVDMFEITDTDGSRFTLVLFDVDGESLAGPEYTLNFLVVANALMFVVDPDQIRGLTLNGSGTRGGDRSFEVVVQRVQRSRRTPGKQYTHLPTAVVVAKADKLTGRGHGLADRWMRGATPPAEELDPRLLAEESEDVWAYLSVFGAQRWLDPARRLAPATLHFASAAGTEPHSPAGGESVFPESGFRQIRVLRPLLALLAAHGVAIRGWEQQAPEPGRRAAR
ncbi:MAG: hypothetical protein HOW97_33525 [Catenulispora sp.]|nr:hypothetical protein [Catenulispora sp.]